jgi:hypothetical protein
MLRGSSASEKKKGKKAKHSFARSGNPFSPPARGGEPFMLRGSSASKVPPTASLKDKKAGSASRSRRMKMKNRRKKGDGAGNSVRSPRIELHQHNLINIPPYGFTSSLLRGTGALL